MSTSTKRPISSILLGLLFSTGMMLLIVAIPIGFTTAFQERYQSHSDWHWAVIAGVAITLAIALVGSISLGLGILIAGCRRKSARDEQCCLTSRRSQTDFKLSHY
jgi:hypothetical protein